MSKIKLKHRGNLEGKVFGSEGTFDTYIRLSTSISCCWYEVTEDGYVWAGMDKSQELNDEFERMALVQAAAKV